MRAIIYALLVISHFEKRGKRKYLYYATPVLLTMDLILGSYSKVIFNSEIPPAIARNWLFTGIPCCMIGMYIREHLDTVKNWLRDDGEKKLFQIIIISMIVIIVVRNLLIITDQLADRDYFLSSTILAIAIFLYFLFFVSQNKNIISVIGKRYSTWIYILHPVFMALFDALIPSTTEIGKIYQYISPIVVFSVTTVFVAIINDGRNILNRQTIK